MIHNRVSASAGEHSLCTRAHSHMHMKRGEYACVNQTYVYASKRSLAHCTHDVPTHTLVYSHTHTRACLYRYKISNGRMDRDQSHDVKMIFYLFARWLFIRFIFLLFHHFSLAHIRNEAREIFPSLIYLIIFHFQQWQICDSRGRERAHTTEPMNPTGIRVTPT